MIPNVLGIILVGLAGLFVCWLVGYTLWGVPAIYRLRAGPEAQMVGTVWRLLDNTPERDWTPTGTGPLRVKQKYGFEETWWVIKYNGVAVDDELPRYLRLRAIRAAERAKARAAIDKRDEELRQALNGFGDLGNGETR